MSAAVVSPELDFAAACCLLSSGGPRLVPSFPTRRSSDLVCVQLDTGAVAIVANAQLPEPEGPEAGLRALGFGQLDRKSTRLNSSHMSSSYAVFCLKKKIVAVEDIGHTVRTVFDPHARGAGERGSVVHERCGRVA